MKMSVGLRGLFAAAVICAYAGAAPDSAWTVARSAHFEVYSQAGVAPARSAILWFEQLHAFFSGQMKLDPDSRPPVRVIGFRSEDEYREYSTRLTSDAYYVGTESRDFIVMPRLGAGQFGVAAHEYAHVLLHAGGLRLPSWLGEGLAEFLSSVHIADNSSTIGGDLPARSRTLKRPWIPLPELFSITADSAMRKNRDATALFYAQSWAMVHMLVLSPEYGPRFPELVRRLRSGGSSSEALAAVYGKSLETIADDAHGWMLTSHFTPIAMPGVPTPNLSVQVASVSPVTAQLLLGDLLFTSGELDRAEALYRDLERQAPGLPEIPAALGSIALRKDDRDGARQQWRRAMNLGINDPQLCYRYAAVAQEAGLDPSEIRSALERAIAIQPGFDDARFTLALLEMNQGHFDGAVRQFRAMKSIAPARAYGYWSALAYSLTELDLRAEAKAAAAEAARFAATPQEREHAINLGMIADTDLAVRFTRDANGRAQLSTARAPHNQPDWNPFIEPGDRIHRVDATLDEIHCDGDVTRIAVTAGHSRLVLMIPDPGHVQMRNAPPEFTCGPQSPRPIVRVEYADATQGGVGIVRGIEFR